jgi:uncharacterized protein YndB with AHSA1/START domain
MAPITSTITIRRPPDVVFGYVTDPSRFTEWQADVRGARADTETRFVTTRRIGGSDRTMTQEVTESAPPHRWSVRGVDGPLRPNMTVTIEPVDGGKASSVTFALDFEGAGFGDLLVPVVRAMAARGAPKSYQRLKEILEAGGS